MTLKKMLKRENSMRLIKCTADDVSRLAAMNKRLIEDEKSSNSMAIKELEDRMKGFITGEYKAFFFEEEGQIVGYALVRHTSEPFYLRQFYIEREHRRKHYGKQAFKLLMDHLDKDVIDIDVLPWNEAGLCFWKSLGFTETCISMRSV